MGFFFVQLKPWEERGREHTAAIVTQALNRAFAGSIREAAVLAFGPPAIPGLGTGAGLHLRAAGSQRRHAGVSRCAGAAIHRRRAQAAGDRPHQHALSRLGSADLRGHRSEQGNEVRRPAQRRQHDARRAARQLVHQRLQQVRPRVQGVPPGRARVPPRREPAGALLRPQPGWRHGAARHADHDASERRARVHQSLQPVPRGGNHRRTGGRVLVGAGARRTRSRRRARCCRRT